MLKGMLQGQKGLILGLVALCGGGESLQACGDFRLPQNHFEGVTALGYVSIWKQIDSLDLGDLKVPVVTGFQTYRQQPSPELGSGWFLPLMDANIVQTDEKTFRMAQPDGKNETLKRDKENPNILHGTGGWTAEIVGNDITVHSQCGSGWKLVYTNGKLTSLSKGSHTLTIQRDEMGRGIAVRDGLTPVMTLEQDQATGLAKSIQIGDQKYQLAYDGKPRIENVQGQNLVGGVEPSLHQITYPQEQGGKKETYDFAVTEKILPDLKITDTEGKERMIVWGLDGRMLQDGEWSYDIKPGSDPKGNAAIGRTNAKNQREFWHRDLAKGKEIVQGIDGVKKVTLWFISGKLLGRVRQSNDGYRQEYNEHGYLIRQHLGDTFVEYHRSQNGKVTKEFRNGKQYLERFYSGDKVSKIVYSNGLTQAFSYNENKVFVTNVLPSGFTYYEYK
jgi:YD repeat-containing protein